jgi:hypothetical protein
MKKITIFSLLILSFVFVNAQKAVATHEQLEEFYKTTTCIVFDSDIFNSYNNAIEEAVKQCWTITPYKFITMKEFNQMMNKSGYSFLVRTKVTPEKNPGNVAYTFLSLVMGEANKTFSQLPEICSFPLSYYNVDYEKYDYKLGALLRFVQNHIELTYNNPDLNEKNILSYYNKNIKDIGNKTIYLNEENLADEINTVSKIKKYYSGNVEIVDADEIKQHINDKDENAIILHIVMPASKYQKDKCYKMLIGAADGQLYYYDAHKINTKKPGKFLKSDFVKINKKE